MAQGHHDENCTRMLIHIQLILCEHTKWCPYPGSLATPPELPNEFPRHAEYR